MTANGLDTSYHILTGAWNGYQFEYIVYLYDVENVTLHGGAGNDSFSRSAGNNTFYGNDGDDALSGGSGNDACRVVRGTTA